MDYRNLLAGALAACALGAIPVPTRAAVDFRLDFAPPLPRHEVVPAPRHGWVWSPGYWDWRRGRYVWRQGHWVRERRGYHWHPEHWARRDGYWVLERGAWRREPWEHRRFARRDEDRDGIPNRRDRDRDGDGVRNRYDRAPDNPYRR